MAHPRRHTSHGKELYFILFIVLLAASLMLSIWGPGGYKEMKRVRLELQMHKARVEALERSNKDRVQAIENLRSNKLTLEKYAREKGYGKQGDIVQQLPEQPDAKR